MSKSFAEMTEEEKIEWAKNHTWKSRKRTGDNHMTTAKAATAYRKLKARESYNTMYRESPKRRAQFMDDYNARIRYLYTHNEEFRELKKYRVALRLYRKRRVQYDKWTDLYYKNNKGRMHTKAATFKLENSENYVYGFAIKDLLKYSPIGKAIFNRLLSELVIPSPKYRGNRWKKDKEFVEEVEEFYLVSELEDYLSIFAAYRKKYYDVSKESNKAFLKKKFWERMMKSRKRFEDD